jgi:tetratricopeptide (TPR) repeat protein
MGREDWYRRKTWSAVDMREFYSRLARSRSSANKAQYMCCQAGVLAKVGYHAAAIELLDQVIRDYPERIVIAEAHAQKARSFVALNMLDLAIDEFRSSLDAERRNPSVRTTSCLEFPLYIVRQRLTELYDEALAILDEFADEALLSFPNERYQYATVRALIAAARDEYDSAKEFARIALELETVSHSGFRSHPTVNLVKEIDPEIHERLIALERD